MGDRITVMRDGTIEQTGTFDELYYTPVNLFVATFIGTPPINLLPADYNAGRITIGGQSWEVPENLAVALSPGKIKVGVRPESWLLDVGAPLQVSHIERMPTERASFLHGNWLGNTIIALAPLEHPEVPSLPLQPDWEKVLIFEAEGESVLFAPGAPEFF
jgi:ABC-type sugar transport system ATPase subunit